MSNLRPQFKCGTTEQSLLYTGLPGEFTVDTDLNAIRVHDGITPGGHCTAQAPAGPTLPGASVLTYGTETIGFYGEVPVADLITGDALALAIGLSAGTSQFSNEPWLKYSYNGETRFVAKKPYRYNLSWESIYQAGAVWGTDTVGPNPSGANRTQDASVTIDGTDYRVMLLGGGNANPTANTTGYDVTAGVNSEWNELFYRIHSTTHIDTSNTTASEGSPVPWVSYTDADLHMHNSLGNGTYCWTKETHGASSTYRVFRGSYGVSRLPYYTATGVYPYFGWRPALIPVL